VITSTEVVSSVRECYVETFRVNTKFKPANEGASYLCLPQFKDSTVDPGYYRWMVGTTVTIVRQLH